MSSDGYPRKVRKLRTAVVVGGLLSTLLAVTGAPSASATPCGSDYGNYHDGYARYPTGQTEVWEGAQAVITVQAGGFCGGQTGAYNFNTAWVMLQGSAPNEYAQAGFMKYNGDSNDQEYAEWRDGNGAYHRVKHTDLTNGDTHKIWVQYLPSNGHLSMNFDGAALEQTPFDLFGTFQEPFIPSWNGETEYKETSIPGIASAKVSFTPIRFQRTDNNAYQNIATSLLKLDNEENEPTSWRYDLPNSTTVQIWLSVLSNARPEVGRHR